MKLLRIGLELYLGHDMRQIRKGVCQTRAFVDVVLLLRAKYCGFTQKEKYTSWFFFLKQRKVVVRFKE